jgi:hypothetical protein
MKMEQAECSETLAYKIQAPGNCPEESIQHSEHGKSLKSRIIMHMFLLQHCKGKVTPPQARLWPRGA